MYELQNTYVFNAGVEILVKHLNIGGRGFLLYFFLRFLSQFWPPQVSSGLGAANNNKIIIIIVWDITGYTISK